MTAPTDSDEITLALKAAAAGNGEASDRLLPLVYHQLRALAAVRMKRIPPGNTLQPTALVHEAYLKLFSEGASNWDGRRHFFAAAAQAMRDILVYQARRKAAVKRGGNRRRIDLAQAEPEFESPREDVLALDEALTRLESEDARKGAVLKLRFFVGLSRAETAEALGVSEKTIERDWRYIKARLRRELGPTGITKAPHDE